MLRRRPILLVFRVLLQLVVLFALALGPAVAAPLAPSAPATTSGWMKALAPFPIAVTATNHLPAIAYNPTDDEYLVVWHTSYPLGGTRDVWGQRVARSGALIGQNFLISTDPLMENFQPSVAYDIGYHRYLVVWIRAPSSDPSAGDVLGRFVPWDGPSAGSLPFEICNWSSSQWAPKVAYTPYPFDAPSFMVVWWNEPAAPVAHYISGRLVYADGSMPYGGFEIASGSEDRQMPDIAVTPLPYLNRYLVAYEVLAPLGANSEVRGRLVTQTGVPSGPEFPVSDAGEWIYGLQSNPAVASCGNEFAVVYQRSVNQHDVYLQFIDGAGGKIGSIVRIALTSADETQPDVACGGDWDRYLVAWRQQFAGQAGYGIEGALAYASGAVGAYQLLDRPDSGMQLNRAWPAIASDSGYYGGHYGFLVADEHDRSVSGPLIDIYGIRVLTRDVMLPLILKSG